MWWRGWTALAVVAWWMLWASSARAISVQDVPNPRPNGGWVSDQAELLDTEAEGRLDAQIDDVARDLGVEIAVVTVHTVDTATPKDFATELFNHWGIGKAGQDNGLLVLMVLGERRLEMETGYGTEAVLSDGWLESMQLRVMVPAFKSGDYAGGLEAGVAECIDRLRKYPDGIPAGAEPDPAGVVAPRSSSSGPPWMWIFTLGGGLVLCIGVGVFKHRRDRSCPSCKIRMAMLPEHEDDEKLDAGQQTEEQIGSVDYQFFYCTQCDFSRLLVDKKWFSGYSSCPSCAYRTATTNSHTVRSATYDSTGLEEITTQCTHCGHHSTHQRTIPMKVRSSSSSSSSGGFSGGGGFSSGGGSFGGGSSGGGGAGSSW